MILGIMVHGVKLTKKKLKLKVLYIMYTFPSDSLNFEIQNLTT